MTKATLFTARIDNTGLTFDAPASTSLLQSAEKANTPGLTMDSSCRNGTCRVCVCRLVKGDVVYRIDWPGLSMDEKREGFILPCVAYPLSDVVLDLTSFK